MKKFIAILMQLTTLATAQVPYYIQGTSGGKTGLVSMLDISGSSVTTATFTNIGGVRTLRLVLTGSGGGGVSSNDCVLIVTALAYPLTSNPSNYVRAAQLGSAAYADLSAFAPSTVTNVDLSGYVGLAGFIGATNAIVGRIVTIEGKTNNWNTAVTDSINANSRAGVLEDRTNTWNGIVNTITVNGVAGSLSSNLNFSVTTGTPIRDDGVGYVTVTMANGTNVVGLTGEAIRSACAEYIATNRYLRADQTTNLVNEIVSPVAALASNAYDTSIINSNAIGGKASTNGTYLLMSVGTATTASTATFATTAGMASNVVNQPLFSLYAGARRIQPWSSSTRAGLPDMGYTQGLTTNDTVEGILAVPSSVTNNQTFAWTVVCFTGTGVSNQYELGWAILGNTNQPAYTPVSTNWFVFGTNEVWTSIENTSAFNPTAGTTIWLRQRPLTTTATGTIHRVLVR